MLKVAQSETVVSGSGLSEREFFVEFFTNPDNPRFIHDIK
jgi:hypothetical protein